MGPLRAEGQLGPGPLPVCFDHLVIYTLIIAS